jgi:hypothetical protein
VVSSPTSRSLAASLVHQRGSATSAEWAGGEPLRPDLGDKLPGRVTEYRVALDKLIGDLVQRTEQATTIDAGGLR